MTAAKFGLRHESRPCWSIVELNLSRKDQKVLKLIKKTMKREATPCHIRRGKHQTENKMRTYVFQIWHKTN